MEGDRLCPASVIFWLAKCDLPPKTSSDDNFKNPKMTILMQLLTIK